MKVIILKTNLKEALSSVERVVVESGSLPILKNVLMRTEFNKLNIVATNLEIGIERFTPAKILEAGSVVVPFGAFYSVISGMDSERITLEVNKGVLAVSTEGYQAKIQSMSGDEFPIIPKLGENSQGLIVDAELLRNSLSSVAQAAQFSEIRPEISGVLFSFEVTTLKLVATDSFRLAEKTLTGGEVRATADRGFRVIVPLKTVQEVVRTFTREQEVTVLIDETQVLFKTGDEELISRVVGGQYPNYEEIVPKSSETEVVMDREKLLGAVKLVSTFSGKVNDIKLKVAEGGKAIEVYSASQLLGENNYLLPAKISGVPFSEVSFNWRYLVDGLRVIHSESVFLGMNGDAKPATVKALDDKSYFYILMPIKAQ
jgi:DNA polymerase-3 subunit beta